MYFRLPHCSGGWCGEGPAYTKGFFTKLWAVFSFLPHCYAFHTHLSFISLCPVLPQSWLYFQYFFLPLCPSYFSELAENWWIENKKLALKCCCCRTSKANMCFVVVQSLNCVQLFVTPWTAALQASLSSTISWSLLKLMSTESVMRSNHLILCHPFLLLPSIFPRIGVFSNESTLHIRWPNYWSFSFNISPSNEYSGLISFKIDCFDLLAVKRTLKSPLQHHSSKASILPLSLLYGLTYIKTLEKQRTSLLLFPLPVE